MELARLLLLLGAVVSLTTATYYRRPAYSRLRPSEEKTERLGKADNPEDQVVKNEEAADESSSENEGSVKKNEEGDLQEAASLQDYAISGYPFPYYQYQLVPVDTGEKTVGERPVINGHGSVNLPGLHLGATIGQGSSHGGSAAAAAAAAAASGGGSGIHGGHHHHQSGGGPSFAAAGSIAGSLPPFFVGPAHHVRPVHHQGGSIHHVPVYHGHGPVYHGGSSYGGPVYHGGVRPIIPFIGDALTAAGSFFHQVGGSHGVHHGSYGVHGQPVYHGESHKPTYHVPVQHVHRPTHHGRPPYSWSNPAFNYHRDLEPFIIIQGLPNVHAAGSINVGGDGATHGLGGFHTTPGNPLVISLPEEAAPVFTNFAQLVQRPFQIIDSLVYPQAIHQKPHHPSHVEPKPVHEPVHYKPVHEPVQKPVHEPVQHKPVHHTAQAVLHKQPVQKPVDTVQKPVETVHKPHYGPGYNKLNGLPQPTNKPQLGQFAKSQITNGGSVVSPNEKKEEIARAETSGADLPSDNNSLDGVVRAEDRKDDLARSASEVIESSVKLPSSTSIKALGTSDKKEAKESTPKEVSTTPLISVEKANDETAVENKETSTKPSK